MEAMVDGGERVGLVEVRLFRPFGGRARCRVARTTRAVAVLDRTKEPGARGAAVPGCRDLARGGDRGRTRPLAGGMPRVLGGRYGLSSKEFTPAMARAALDALDDADAPSHFTVGIVDDVSDSSLQVDAGFDTEHDETVRAVFYGLGSDGTVSANKNSIKIIGDHTDLHAQGYFVYDSRRRAPSRSRTCGSGQNRSVPAI